MRARVLHATLLSLLAAALLPSAALAAGSVRVTLTPQRLGLGQTAQLTFEISRSDLGGMRFTPHFELENFEVVGGPARQDSMTWTNGVLARSYSLTWYLAPQRQGKARVHGLKLTVGDQDLALPDQEAWVDETTTDENGRQRAPGLPPGFPPDTDPFGQLFDELFRRPRPPTAQSAQGLPQILLRAEVTPSRPWAGQQLVYTLYLLAERRPPAGGRVVVETIFPRRVPPFQGFWSQEITLPESSRAEIVELDGKLWWRQAILQRALFAYEPGPHKIDAAEADLRLVYFRPIGFGFAEEPFRPGPVRRQSNALEVAVQALPAKPAAFSGAVGQLQARVRLEPGLVPAGEATVLTAELTGSGNLSGLPDPKLPPLPGVQVSPPQESSRLKVNGTRVDSTRSWTWTLVPQRAGRWSVPAIEWVTFDPQAGAYRTLRTDALALAATPAAPAAPPRPAASPQAAPAARRLWSGPALGSPLVWAVGGAAAALLLAALGLLGSRWVGRGRVARRQLVAQVTAALGDPHPRQAAGAAEEAWRCYLGTRYDLPVEAPPTHWAGLLAKRGLGPTLAGEVVRLVDDLHYLRYAPRLASTDSLQRELLERSRRLARRLG
ncbi:MAG TPA: BatD family protein [Thermoanaerobaculia bacterium]|nr:BatD family protein [Thermoanaerobaculia bacterium]